MLLKLTIFLARICTRRLCAEPRSNMALRCGTSAPLLLALVAAALTLPAATAADPPSPGSWAGDSPSPDFWGADSPSPSFGGDTGMGDASPSPSPVDGSTPSPSPLGPNGGGWMSPDSPSPDPNASPVSPYTARAALVCWSWSPCRSTGGILWRGASPQSNAESIRAACVGSLAPLSVRKAHPLTPDLLFLDAAPCRTPLPRPRPLRLPPHLLGRTPGPALSRQTPLPAGHLRPRRACHPKSLRPRQHRCPCPRPRPRPPHLLRCAPVLAWQRSATRSMCVPAL